MKEIYVKNYSFGHLTLILSLHYLVKYRSHSLAVYNNEFLLDSTCIGTEKSPRQQNHRKSVIRLILWFLL